MFIIILLFNDDMKTNWTSERSEAFFAQYVLSDESNPPQAMPENTLAGNQKISSLITYSCRRHFSCNYRQKINNHSHFPYWF
jgi:hypothetical protein